MKRRIVICLLVLCTLLALLPVFGLAAGASDATIVATVTKDDKVIAETETLSKAFSTAAKNKGSTVKLEADLEITAGFDFGGTFTFDLNGHVIKAHTPLIQTTGTVTIIDSNANKKGAIMGTEYPALELRGTLKEISLEGVEEVEYIPDGNIILASGTFGSEKSNFAVYNNGQGMLYLTGTPKLEKGIYLTASGTLCGHDGAEAPAEYEGDVVSVYYAETPITPGAVLLTGGDSGKFDFIQRDYFIPQDIGDQTVFAEDAYLSYLVTFGVIAVVVILLAVMIPFIISSKKKIKRMNLFTIPAILPFMKYMGDLERLLLVGAAVVFVAMTVVFIVMMAKTSGKVKKAKKK